MTELIANHYLLVPIIITCLTSGYFVIRHFWQKTKCFHLMKQKQEHFDEQLTAIENMIQSNERQTRESIIAIFRQLNATDKKVAETAGKIDVLIKHMKC